LTVLLDSHVLHWWSAEPDKLTDTAATTIESARQLVVSSITWLELAWHAHHGRIILRAPLRTWLQALSDQVLTLGVTPAVAATAVELPSAFPRDPADRLIFATAVEHGWKLVTKDQGIRGYAGARDIVIW